MEEPRVDAWLIDDSEFYRLRSREAKLRFLLRFRETPSVYAGSSPVGAIEFSPGLQSWDLASLPNEVP